MCIHANTPAARVIRRDSTVYHDRAADTAATGEKRDNANFSNDVVGDVKTRVRMCEKKKIVFYKNPSGRREICLSRARVRRRLYAPARSCTI